MTDALQRISTKYSEAEDRIRLAGEVGDRTIVLWLTQRLLNRLVPHLCQWLDQRVGGKSLAGMKHEFAQQKARAELEPQTSVRADAKTPELLVHSVDLKTSNASMCLQFKDADGNEVARLQLRPKPLRQWLNIAYDQYLKAQWPTSVWPAWVAEAKQSPASSRAAVLH